MSFSWRDTRTVSAVGGCIRVEASDNVKVAKMQVTLLDERGSNPWPGELVSPSHTEGKTIAAEARDLPRHVTRLVLQ